MKDTPGISVVAIATLALGLGVTSAVLGLTHAILVKPLPLPEASRLVLVDQNRRRIPRPRLCDRIDKAPHRRCSGRPLRQNRPRADGLRPSQDASIRKPGC